MKSQTRKHFCLYRCAWRLKKATSMKRLVTLQSSVIHRPFLERFIIFHAIKDGQPGFWCSKKGCKPKKPKEKGDVCFPIKPSWHKASNHKSFMGLLGTSLQFHQRPRELLGHFQRLHVSYKPINYQLKMQVNSIVKGFCLAWRVFKPLQRKQANKIKISQEKKKKTQTHCTMVLSLKPCSSFCKPLLHTTPLFC